MVDWFFGVIILAILLLLLLVVGWIVLTNIWHLLDFSFRPSLRCSGTVARKKYIPKYTYMMPLCGGYGVIGGIPQTIPESWQLLINIKAGYGWIAVKRSFYNAVSVGDFVYVTYSIGRFSSRVHLQNIWR